MKKETYGSNGYIDMDKKEFSVRTTPHCKDTSEND